MTLGAAIRAAFALWSPVWSHKNTGEAVEKTLDRCQTEVGGRIFLRNLSTSEVFISFFFSPSHVLVSCSVYHPDIFSLSLCKCGLYDFTMSAAAIRRLYTKPMYPGATTKKIQNRFSSFFSSNLHMVTCRIVIFLMRHDLPHELANEFGWD